MTCRKNLHPHITLYEGIATNILAAKQRLSLDDAHNRVDSDIGFHFIGSDTRPGAAHHFANWFGHHPEKQLMGEKALCAVGAAAP